MSGYHQDSTSDRIQNSVYMLIGPTTTEGRPRTIPVYFTIDKELNIYWASDKNAQHSVNVRENQGVYLMVYNSSDPEGGFVGEGLYVEAIAIELNRKDEIEAARAIIQARRGKTVSENECGRFMSDATSRLYNATPTHAWVNDVENEEDDKYIRDIRVGISLDKLKGDLL